MSMCLPVINWVGDLESIYPATINIQTSLIQTEACNRIIF